MKYEEAPKDPVERIDYFLNKACDAEEQKNYEEAERCFKFALHAESKTRGVKSVIEYIKQVGPVYSKEPEVCALPTV